jgi:probable selenium-dependent hydroxylase accessory protein YqeC
MKSDIELSFLNKFQVVEGNVVSIVGAGGKTSLMHHLANEVREQKRTCLVTTSTRMNIPNKGEYDWLDLTGYLFKAEKPEVPGRYIAGNRISEPGKMRGCDMELLQRCHTLYDFTFIEADGAAKKSLKGWKDTEPVVPGFSSHTIGVVDIQTIGKKVNSSLVHRLPLFCDLTGAREGEKVEIPHLVKLIVADKGLFAKAIGERFVIINKVESQVDIENGQKLRAKLPALQVVLASVKEGKVHD